MDWLAVQAVATVALVVTSGGAISYAALQLKHEREYRMMNNLEEQWKLFLSESMAATRKRLAGDRLSGETLSALDIEAPPASALEMLDFYEHLALLEKRGRLDLYDVWHTFYEWLQPVYADLRQVIESSKSGYQDHYSDLRKMLEKMDKIQRQRMAKPGGKDHWELWTDERVIEHYRHEAEVGGRPRRRRAVR